MTTVLDVAPGVLSDYYDWIKTSKSGDVLIYWVGSLHADRQIKIPENDILRTPDRQRIEQLNIIADRVFKDAKDGHIVLTQRRLKDGVYEYRATRHRMFLYRTHEMSPNDHLVLC